VRVRGLAWSPDGSMLAIAGEDDEGGVLEIRDPWTLALLRETRYPSYSNSPCWSPDGTLIVTPGAEGGVHVHRSRDLELIRTFHSHDEWVSFVDIAPDGNFAAMAPVADVVRIWELSAGREITALENLEGSAGCVKFSPNGNLLATQTEDLVELWRCRDWERVAVIPLGKARRIGGLAFHPSRPLLAIKDDESHQVHCCTINYALLDGAGVSHDSRRYVNAKVVLLGDTGVGKSGLGLVLGGQEYQRTDSTHGRRVWTFDSREVEVPGAGRQTREVMLWDLAGQPGYRLVHQLHLNEITVALLVFDSRSETDPFSGVKHWVRALAQARRLEETTVPLHTYLVAARADRGGVAVSRERVRVMIDDLGLDGFFETSAKEGWQITELKGAIEAAIDWDALPMVSSSVLFDSIKQFLLEEKKQGRVLCTADDLFRSFLRSQPDDTDRNSLRVSFETCIGRVESRDLIRRLHFGGLVLLQPELLDAYASALVQAAKSEPDGLGFVREADALSGRFRLAAEERIPDAAQEKLLLIATVEELLRHEIALKEATDQGVDLVFPSQFTRERPDAPDIADRRVTFVFQGSLGSIYASLAVRLAHSSLFRRETMWQNAASYIAAAGGSCGMHLHELEEGGGELTLFYNEQAEAPVRAQFETYVARHLQQRALPGSVYRKVIRTCAACGYVLPDDLVRGRLRLGKNITPCPVCEESVFSLRDDQPLATAGAAVSEMNRNADEQRDRNVAATRLKGKIETGDYDVFLCHNSKDKQRVMAIGERLKERGVLPWLDVWEIRPGVRWQKELRRVIRSVKTAAVFIGLSGAGPWQELEVESLLGEFAKRDKPIIPVILEGRVGNPRLPAFLDSWHKVDMRNPSPDPFEQLVWGITGEKADSAGRPVRP
jgi:TIR domain/Ras family